MSFSRKRDFRRSGNPLSLARLRETSESPKRLCLLLATSFRSHFRPCAYVGDTH